MSAEAWSAIADCIVAIAAGFRQSLAIKSDGTLYVWGSNYYAQLGIGIAPGMRTRIFQRFERAVSDKHYRGLGLGLYIASEIAKAHGGTISVDSEEGKGSTFTLLLPDVVEGDEEVAA